ncbi:MAG: hypothetical protein ABSD41_12475, partial [Candidatus Bathyarchaeia archaeon]
AIFGKHSISELDVNELDFDGYKKTIEHSSSFIVIRIKKISRNKVIQEGQTIKFSSSILILVY